MIIINRSSWQIQNQHLLHKPFPMLVKTQTIEIMFFTTICAVNYYVSGLMKRSSLEDSSNRKIMAFDKRFICPVKIVFLAIKSRSGIKTKNSVCLIHNFSRPLKSNFHANHLWYGHCQGRKLGKPPWEILVAKVIGNWCLRLHMSTLSHETWAHFFSTKYP